MEIKDEIMRAEQRMYIVFLQLIMVPMPLSLSGRSALRDLHNNPMRHL
jgi:hypothetical protein